MRVSGLGIGFCTAVPGLSGTALYRVPEYECEYVSLVSADQRTDGPTEGRTDTPSYRDARTHLKNLFLLFYLNLKGGMKYSLRRDRMNLEDILTHLRLLSAKSRVWFETRESSDMTTWKKNYVMFVPS